MKYSARSHNRLIIKAHKFLINFRPPDGLFGLAGLLRLEKVLVDVGQDSSTWHVHVVQKSVQLFIAAASQYNVSGLNANHLGISRGISSKLQDLSHAVLQDSSQVDCGTRAASGSEPPSSKIPADSAHGKLETGLGTGRAPRTGQKGLVDFGHPFLFVFSFLVILSVGQVLIANIK